MIWGKASLFAKVVTSAGLAGPPKTLKTVLKTLDKAGDDVRVGVVEQVADEIRGLQVRLVAGGDDVGVANAQVDRSRQKGAKRRGAALRDERDRAAAAHDQPAASAGPDAGLHVGHTEAIRPGDPHAGLAGESTDVALQVAAPGVASFGKAGRG